MSCGPRNTAGRWRGQSRRGPSSKGLPQSTEMSSCPPARPYLFNVVGLHLVFVEMTLGLSIPGA